MGQPAENHTTQHGAIHRNVKKGELLFAEGETSRAMYYVKSGILRVFKKKGESNIEIDTIRTGQILGELAFLDGNPRSASAEALTDCDLIEISGPTFISTLEQSPDWLKLLLKTVVGRLRAAGTRIKQLENSSTAYDYDETGKGTKQYVFLGVSDVLKICSAILLVASRTEESADFEREISMSALQRYSNQIMGVPIAKLTTVMDILVSCDILAYKDEKTGSRLILTNMSMLDDFINYYNDENLSEPSKRHDLTLKGFLIMGLIAKHIDQYPKDVATGNSAVNLAEIKTKETAALGKEPFRMDDFPELVKHGYASQVSIKSNEAIFTQIKSESFKKAFQMQKIVKSIEATNEQKMSKK